MISWMQKHRKYLVVTIWISTIAFVGAGFVGWGAYSFSANKSNSVATVGDTEITGSQLQSSYSNIYSYYNQMLGGKLTKEKAEQLHIQDIALNQLVDQTLLLNYAKSLGIKALDSEIVAKINSIDSFKKDGVFSKDQYFNTLKAMNKKTKEFEKEIEKEIILTKLTDALKLKSTKLEIDTIGSSIYLQDKIKAKLVTVNDSDVNVSEEAIKGYWENHKNDFMSDKTYTVEIIKVIAADIDIDDKKLKEFYRENKTTFKGDDDKILSFDDAKEAVKKRLQFKIAKKNALKKYLQFKDNKIKADETLTIKGNNKEIPTMKIANAKVGSYIKSIRFKDGFITAKLDAVNEPKPLEFGEAKDKAKDALFKSEKIKLLERIAKKESSDLKDAKDLGFISREDAKKVLVLNEDEAQPFLNHLFSQTEKNGYYILADKAVAYEIVDQKLEFQEENQTKKEQLVKSIETLKSNTTQAMLIKQLKKLYKIEKH